MSFRKKGRNVNQFVCITKKGCVDTILMIYKEKMDTIQIQKIINSDTIQGKKMARFDTFNIMFSSKSGTV